jgi:DNA mismatch endonuclease, patch repair protein
VAAIRQRPVPLDDHLAARMARVRRRDTGPELQLRHELHRRGLRYRVDAPPVDTVRGRADIVFGRVRVAVYVDGCFWHGCPEHGTLPRNNRAWWQTKLAANRARDAAIVDELARHGWLAVRVWEHEDMAVAADRVERLVRARRLCRSAGDGAGQDHP